MRFTVSVLALMLCGTALADALPDADKPAEIALQQHGHGWVLTTAAGMTLYTYVKDQKFDAPICEGKCVAAWPPLLASNDAQPKGEWSVTTRKDGSKQWAFRGKPLYAYRRDTAVGDMNGDDLNQEWYVAVKPLPTPPGIATLKTAAGYLLIDQKKMTLYTSDKDKADASVCEGPCARTWKPVEASWLAAANLPAWTMLNRKDGTRQWVFKGKPLYRYAGDFNPGEIAGNTARGWHAVVLEPPPPIPSWITVQESDAGELLADGAGKTLYAHNLTKERLGISDSAREMETPQFWTPVAAKPEEKPVGYWSIVTREDGSRQWAFKGMPLFVHARDVDPGDVNGMRATDRVWRTIMKSGQSMPGTQN